MTLFEQFAVDIIGKVETDSQGLYTKHTNSLACITNDVILSDDEQIFNLSWEEQKKIIAARFYSVYPYMRREN